MGTLPDASGRGAHRLGTFHIRTKVTGDAAGLASVQKLRLATEHGLRCVTAPMRCGLLHARCC